MGVTDKLQQRRVYLTALGSFQGCPLRGFGGSHRKNYSMADCTPSLNWVAVADVTSQHETKHDRIFFFFVDTAV